MQTLIAWGSSKILAKKIANNSDTKLIIPEVSKFPNLESRIFFKELPKQKNVKILLTFEENTNNKLIETFLVIDALQNVNEYNIELISPWLPYSPQDKIFRKGEPLSSKLILDFFSSLNINKISCVDIHSTKVLENTDLKVINLDPTQFYAQFLDSRYNFSETWKVVTLDKGATERTAKMANALNLELIKFSKVRSRTTDSVSFKGFSGEVKNKNLIIYDDFLSTGSTIIKASEYLKGEGANSIIVLITHSTVEKSLERIENSDIDKLFVSNTFNRDLKYYQKIESIDISEILINST